jgi:hypothetical protein
MAAFFAQINTRMEVIGRDTKRFAEREVKAKKWRGSMRVMGKETYEKRSLDIRSRRRDL